MAVMSLLRKTDLSLFYYLKDVVLRDFIEKEEEIPLSYMPEISSDPDDISCNKSLVYEALSDMEPSPTERGRGWVYLDEYRGFDSTMCSPVSSGVPEQVSRVTVYSCAVSGTTTTLSGIDTNEYLIDYMDGRIVTSGTCQPAFVSYWWNYVSLVDEWATVTAADPPVVVINIHGTDKMGYQLGAGKKAIRKVDLHIFATDPAERNDIVEVLYDGLYNNSCPLFDFSRGTILDYDGTWYGRKNNMDRSDPATNFNITTVSGVIGNLLFDNVVARNVNLPLLMTRNRNEVMLSDLNAYRSKISFDLVSYTRS